MNFFLILFSCFFVIRSTALRLSPEQMYSARGLLLNPNTTPGQRVSVQKLLYKSHEKWAIKKAMEFKQLHHYKCTDISKDELILCGKMGLFKSSRNYNGRAPFTKYAEIYVKSELLKVMTKRLAGAILHITSSTNNISVKPAYKSIVERIDAHPELASKSNLEAKQYALQERLRVTMWRHINKQDGFTQRIFCYKYDFDFVQIRSNVEVAKLMACSEETIRKTVSRANEKLRKELVQML